MCNGTRALCSLGKFMGPHPTSIPGTSSITLLIKSGTIVAIMRENRAVKDVPKPRPFTMAN